MKGMIANAKAPETKSPDTEQTSDTPSTVKDSALQQIIQGVEAKVQQAPPQIQQQYHAIVLAAMKIMFSPQMLQTGKMQQYLQKIQTPQQIPQYVSHGVLFLIAMIVREAKGKMSVGAAALAKFTLMAQALDLVEKKGLQVTPDLIAQTTEALNAGFFKMFGITPEKVNQAVQNGRAAVSKQPSSSQPPVQAPAQPPQPTGMVKGA